MSFTNLPEELLQTIMGSLGKEELISLLSIPKLNVIAQSKLFSVLKFNADLQLPPASVWEYVTRLECYNVQFSQIKAVIGRFKNLQQLVLDDDCEKDVNLSLPKVHTLILGNSMCSELTLPHHKFKMLAISVTMKNWKNLMEINCNVLHLTVENYTAFIQLLPYLRCDELFVYGDEFFELESIQWRKSSHFKRLNLCGVLNNQFVEEMLRYTSSDNLNLELIELSGTWKTVLKNHPTINILIHDETILEDHWTHPIESLYVNGSLVPEAASMCALARKIVFDKCETGNFEHNISLLLLSSYSRLEKLTVKNYDVKMPEFNIPVNYINCNVHIVDKNKITVN